MTRRAASSDVLSTVAQIAASGDPLADKIGQILHTAEGMVHVEGWMVWARDPLTGDRMRVYATGYPGGLMTYLDGRGFDEDVVAPFSQAESGWPARVRDVPFKPQELRCMVDHYLPVGFVEGLVAPLVSVSGRCTGFLDCSTSDRRHPSDEARGLMTHLSRILGRLIDPVEESRRAMAILGDEEYVIRIECAAAGASGCAGSAVEMLRPGSGSGNESLLAHFANVLPAVVEPMGRWWATQFLCEGPSRQWYRCRCLRRHDGSVIVGISSVGGAPYGLSRRELEVLTLVADGASNDGIAQQLVVTTRTVKAHVEQIFGKLEVATRSAAAMKAVEEGILLRPGRCSAPAGPLVGKHLWPGSQVAAGVTTSQARLRAAASSGRRA